NAARIVVNVYVVDRRQLPAVRTTRGSTRTPVHRVPSPRVTIPTARSPLSRAAPLFATPGSGTTRSLLPALLASSSPLHPARSAPQARTVTVARIPSWCSMSVDEALGRPSAYIHRRAEFPA